MDKLKEKSGKTAVLKKIQEEMNRLSTRYTHFVDNIMSINLIFFKNGKDTHKKLDLSLFFEYNYKRYVEIVKEVFVHENDLSAQKETESKSTRF